MGRYRLPKSSVGCRVERGVQTCVKPKALSSCLYNAANRRVTRLQEQNDTKRPLHRHKRSVHKQSSQPFPYLTWYVNYRSSDCSSAMSKWKMSTGLPVKVSRTAFSSCTSPGRTALTGTSTLGHSRRHRLRCLSALASLPMLDRLCDSS